MAYFDKILSSDAAWTICWILLAVLIAIRIYEGVELLLRSLQ